MKNPNSLTWGLFNCRFPYHWGKDFIIMLKRIPYVIKHGHYPQMMWETYYCSIAQWKELLTWYRNNRTGAPFIISLPEDGNMNDEWYAENDRVYDEKLNAMLAELDIMAKDPFDYDDYREGERIREKAKDHFFEMFKEMFYTLWD